MSEPIDWHKIQRESLEHNDKMIKEASRQGSVNRDYYGAGIKAKQSIIADELLPSPTPYGEYRYSIQQGLKAACHGREDIAAVNYMQMAILRRLQGLRWMGWIAIALLAYIAVRVT
ncbi:hypothetical protein [Pseudoxanthomonas mexicana]